MCYELLSCVVSGAVQFCSNFPDKVCPPLLQNDSTTIVHGWETVWAGETTDIFTSLLYHWLSCVSSSSHVSSHISSFVSIYYSSCALVLSGENMDIPLYLILFSLC